MLAGVAQASDITPSRNTKCKATDFKGIHTFMATVDRVVDGDTVLIEHSLNTLEGEGVYVIHLDDHLYAKRLQRQFDGAIHIISENKAYKDMVVPKAKLNDLRIIGRVVWAGGWL